MTDLVWGDVVYIFLITLLPLCFSCLSVRFSVWFDRWFGGWMLLSFCLGVMVNLIVIRELKP